MPRSLSIPTASAAAQQVTEPGYLFEAVFTYTVRYSSRGDVTWNGNLFTEANLRVGALSQSPDGSAKLQIAVGNTDRAFGAVVLNEAPQGKRVSVWAFFANATGDADPIALFSGVIDACDEIDESVVTLQLTQPNQGTLFVPRRRITRTSGFNRLSPSGRIVIFNGVQYTLTSRRS